MQTRHLLITLLVIAHVLIGLVVWSMGELLPEYRERLLLLAVVASSQVGLLAIWTALGRRAAPWRLAALIAAVVGWSWILSSIQGGGLELVVFLLPSAATVVVILVVARFYGLRFYIIDAEPADIEDNRPWQFTLSRLFAWTTSLAICLGLLSLTFRHCHDWNADNLLAIPIFTIGSTAVILFCCLWLTLTGLRRQLLVSLLVILLFGFGLFVHIHHSILLLFALKILLIVATLLVFRVAGYRLSWKRKNS